MCVGVQIIIQITNTLLFKLHTAGKILVTGSPKSHLKGNPGSRHLNHPNLHFVGGFKMVNFPSCNGATTSPPGLPTSAPSVSRLPTSKRKKGCSSAAVAFTHQQQQLFRESLRRVLEFFVGDVEVPNFWNCGWRGLCGFLFLFVCLLLLESCDTYIYIYMFCWIGVRCPFFGILCLFFGKKKQNLSHTTKSVEKLRHMFRGGLQHLQQPPTIFGGIVGAFRIDCLELLVFHALVGSLAR